MTMNMQHFNDAFLFASRLHDGQMRKGSSVPYLSHLMAVSALVMENGGTQDQAIAALLHDTVEDQGGEETLSEIRERFGDDVASIVEECSESLDIKDHPWRERKEWFLNRIVQMSERGLLVCVADKFHNVQGLINDHRNQGDQMWSSFNAGKTEQLWYYRSVAALLCERTENTLATTLSEKVDELEARCAETDCTTT